MKIDAIRFGFAAGIVFAAFWVVCSLLVLSMPAGTMQVTGHMTHADFGHMTWRLNFVGFAYGLIAWSVLAGLVAAATAAVYNRLIGGSA
ncbi:MAG: DUF5676 family membrane protein [Erythrobacter sp.]|jgi:hypothetical protein